VALVTGASSGLGYRFAKVLAAAGAKVAVAARRLERLEALAHEIRDAGGTALAVEMDATDAEQLVAAAARAEAELGTVTILINNAGVPDAQRAHKMSIELIDRVLDVNVRAPFILACEVARRLGHRSALSLDYARPAPGGTSTHAPQRKPADPDRFGGSAQASWKGLPERVRPVRPMMV